MLALNRQKALEKMCVDLEVSFNIQIHAECCIISVARTRYFVFHVSLIDITYLYIHTSNSLPINGSAITVHLWYELYTFIMAPVSQPKVIFWQYKLHLYKVLVHQIEDICLALFFLIFSKGVYHHSLIIFYSTPRNSIKYWQICDHISLVYSYFRFGVHVS